MLTTSTSPDKTAQSASRWVWISLVLILLLAAFLRFYDLGAQGYGNTYYAATVKSMLTSWHNFLYASFEPGGSVTVDKPPLGFWVQCFSALLFGVNGYSLALPQALAGVGSVALLFFLLRTPFGSGPALLGSFVLAVTPVAVSAERNNTIDGQLAFVLLLAAWALLRSLSNGRLRWLLLSALLVGIGFNIKMLQAYMVLPGFYLTYFLAARHDWMKRIFHLAVATLLIGVVSFAWVAAVDLTPASDRPYIGSSTNNSMFELVFGHNGSERFSMGIAGFDSPSAGANAPANQPAFQGPPSQDDRRPPKDGQNTGMNAARPGGTNETGSPGILRLFQDPMINEIGWALPLALAGMVIATLVLWRRGWRAEQSPSLLLWGGWLIPCLMFFSFTSGIFHSYYVIMIAAPLAALVCAGGWALLRLREEKPRLALGMAALLGTATLAYQILYLRSWPTYLGWVVLASGLLLAVAFLLQFLKNAARWANLSIYLLLLVALVAPTLWSALTTFNSNSNGMLPKSGPQSNSMNSPARPGDNTSDDALMAYILANAPAEGYLLATESANEAAPFILATGRAVLTFGGFTGSDPIVDVEKLAALVNEGQIKLVMIGQSQPAGRDGQSEISAWLAQNCAAVNFATAGQQNDPSRPPMGNLPLQNQIKLYNCGK